MTVTGLAKDLLESNPDGAVLVDKNGTIIYVNSKFCELTGYVAEEVVNQPLEILIPEKYRKIHKMHHKTYMKHPDMKEMANFKSGMRELELLCKNGDGLLVAIALTPVMIDSTTNHVLATIRDITKQKETETKLEQFGRILDSSFDEIYVFDSTTMKFLRANKGALNNIGYSEEELQSLTPVDLKPEFTPEEFEVKYLTPLREGKREHVVFETYHLRKDGSTYPVEVRLQLATSDGQEYFIAVILDITLRKRTENALKEQENYLRAIIETTPECICVVGQDGIILDINPKGLEVLGRYEKETTLGTSIIDAVISSDRPSVTKAIRSALEGETHRVEFTIMRSGNHAWLDARLAPLLDSENVIVASLVVIRDITDRRLAEDKLRKSEAQLAKAQEIAHVGSWIWDIATGELDWSDEVYRIFGQTHEFVPTYERFIDLIHSDDQQIVTDAVRQSISHTTPYRVEHRIVRPGGDIRFVAERGELAVNERGTPVRMVGIVHDITDRKHAEMEIERLAFTDSLTGLYNRRSFDESISQQIARHRRSQGPFALMLIDLDDFGTINNTLGHQAGDELLISIAKRLSNNFKRQTDIVARLGGDEFVVLMTHIDDDPEHVCRKLASNLVEALKQPHTVAGKPMLATASVGVALCWGKKNITADDMLKAADEAMYEAKKAGKCDYRLTSIS